MTIYFYPNWDLILSMEIKKVEHNNFYLSGTMMNEGQIKFNCGNTPNEFNENQFLNEYGDIIIMTFKVLLGHLQLFIVIYGLK